MVNVVKRLKLEQQDQPGEEPRSLDRDSPIPLRNLGNTCYENSIIQCLFSLNMFMDSFQKSMEITRQFVVKPKPINYDVQNFIDLEKQQQEEEENQLQDDKDEKEALNVTTITESDVKYRIADAFDKLYKSYTTKRSEIECTNQPPGSDKTLHSDLDTFRSKLLTKLVAGSQAITVGCAQEIPESSAITEKQPSTVIQRLVQLQNNKPEKEEPLNNETNETSSTTTSVAPPTPPPPTPPPLPPSSATIISKATTTTTTTANLTPIALMSSTTTANEQQEIETRLEELKSAVGERSSQFNSTHQQDASEFFYHVIDSIQEFYQSLGKSNDDDNPVTKAFELELDYLIRCPKCHHKSLTEPEKIRTLPLALPHINSETSSSVSQSNQEEFNHETNGAPTPPTSDLGLDSPESSTLEQEQRNGLEEKENNQALVVDENNVINRDDSSSNNTSVSNNTMSISKLELTDKKDDDEKKESQQQKQEESTQQQQQEDSNQQQKHYTLNDALNNYFKDEILECNCSQDGCDSKQRTKKCLIRKLPQVLFITLARYSYTGKKNLDEIEAPFELSVPFKENISPSHSPSSHNKFANNDNNKYQLVAVVCHLGSSLNAGHYTSYVYNQTNYSWYSCDDDSITKVQEADVKNDATKSGYCFFYAHQSCIAQKPQQNLERQKETTTNKKENTLLVTCSVADSSVVLTPESSPKSSPSPTSKFQERLDEVADDDDNQHHHHHPKEQQQQHTCCLNDCTMDDWS